MYPLRGYNDIKISPGSNPNPVNTFAVSMPSSPILITILTIYYGNFLSAVSVPNHTVQLGSSRLSRAAPSACKRASSGLSTRAP